MLTKVSTVILKRALNAEGEFHAYASTWGTPPDTAGDIFAKGAFRAALATHQKAGTRPAMFWNHESSEVVGTWIELREDERGLFAHGRLTLGTVRGREALALLKDDALSPSVGFTLKPSGSRQRGSIREITEVERLIEVSLVACPANPAARVLEVKSLPASPREFEKLLRDVGFSSRQAKSATAAGWRGIARDERSPLDTVLSRIEDLQRSIEGLKHER